MPTPYSYNSSSNAGATSFAVAGVNGLMTAGDVLVVNVWSAQTATGVTDTKGNSYVLANAKGGASQWVTTGKTVALVSGDSITITLAASGAGNAVVIGVPGAVYAPVDAINSATGTGTSASVSTGTLITNDGQTAIAMVASAASLPTWTGSFTGLATSHGASPEFVGTAYQAGVGSSGATASATLTSGAWSALVVTLQMTSFVNAAPSPPTQYAGKLATSPDMNALANAALFLRRPPMVIAQSATGGTGQAFTGGSQAAVQWSSLQRDTDGFYSPSQNTRLTVQTPGIYKVRYSAPFAPAGVSCQGMVRITTGANNPAGAGVQTSFWYSMASVSGSLTGLINGGGVLPVFLYVLDYIEIMLTVNTTSNMPTTPQPAIVSMRMVSL